MYKFYGDPTAISYLPLRIFYEEASKGNLLNFTSNTKLCQGKHKNASTSWVNSYINSQIPIEELTKYLLKTIDSR